MNVGFIGLGRMGMAMALRLCERGHQVVAFNRGPGPRDQWALSGGTVAETIGDTAQSGIVVTMLKDDEALAAVSPALTEALPAGGVHMAMGTHSVDFISALATEHRGRGQWLVSAPMLGRPEAVAAGKASVVYAGNPAATARCVPLLVDIAAHAIDAGHDAASAIIVKLANNLLLGCAIEAMGEAFSLVEKWNVPTKALEKVIKNGGLASPAYAAYAELIADKAFDKVGFDAKLALKDATLIFTAAATESVPLPSGNVWRDRLLSAVANGDGDLDWAVMAKEQARAAGIR